MTSPVLEICANSYTSALAAQIGGATRVELCENMAEGGTTPSYGQISLCTAKLNINIWPIIRPRGGDFVYTPSEFDLMKADVEICKQLGCQGIVSGILLPNGEIDLDRCKELLEIAYPLPVAFHRAFDRCNDLTAGLEQLIKLGFVRVLTSGAAPTAPAGKDMLAKLVIQAAGRIEIMPGAGINPSNIKTLREYTGATIFHSSARAKVRSGMQYKKPWDNDANDYEQTSAEIVRQLVDALTTS